MGTFIFGVAALTWTACAEEKKGTVVDFDGQKSVAPAEWKEEPPSNQMRYMQFRLPRVEGDSADAELVIFRGLGGSAKANIERWKGQFQPPEGKKIDDVAKVSEFKVGDVPVTYLDISGTYLDKFPPFAPNAKTVPKPNYRMLAVHFDGPKNVYHIKLVGPAKTVAKYQQGFEEWVKAFK
ncbi:MAG: hypothetical protein RMJ52_14455 [Gemmataceae bacterium]|nr:hypothetical protein [Gemmataceae bacterium]